MRNETFLWCALIPWISLDAMAAECPATGSGMVWDGFQFTSVPGTTCTVPSARQPAWRITASGGGRVVADGAVLSVPYGIAVNALDGGEVVLGVDAVTGGGHIGALYAGSGGLTGLSAQGVGSTIRADALSLTLPASNVLVQALAGGQAVLSGGRYVLQGGGGGGRGFVAQGTGSVLDVDAAMLTLENGGGGDRALQARDGASIRMREGGFTLQGQGGGEVGAWVEAAELQAREVAWNVDAPWSQLAWLGDGAVLDIAASTLQGRGTGTAGFRFAASAQLQLDDTRLGTDGDAFQATGGHSHARLTHAEARENGGVLMNVSGDAHLLVQAGASSLRGTTVTGDAAVSQLALWAGALWEVPGDSHLTTLQNDASVVRFDAPKGDPARHESYAHLSAANFSGQAGHFELNTWLGGDDSPSDRLLINGGTASGGHALWIRNSGGEGVRTLGDGIVVVEARNGGRSDPDAFLLGAPVRAGAFDYALVRGDIAGQRPQDWFLRSSFEVVAPEPSPEPEPPLPPPLPAPPEDPVLPDPGEPEPPLPPAPTPPPEDEPPAPVEVEPAPAPEPVPEQGERLPEQAPPTPVLPPGRYPDIGPDLANDGTLQPMARQVGVALLGTWHERVGEAGLAPARDTRRPAPWVRFVAQDLQQRYRAYADPRVDGTLRGWQLGADLLVRDTAQGGRQAWGAYVGYGDARYDVAGLSTAPTRDNYMFGPTGRARVQARALGVTYTQGDADGGYLDAVLQGVDYDASTQSRDASLAVDGRGLIASVEIGRAFAVTPRMLLEPQAQLLWQRVSFARGHDGLSMIDPGSSEGFTSRLGVRLRGQGQARGGTAWWPYLRLNLWRDSGGQAVTGFDHDQVPLAEQATRLELAVGFSANLGTRWMLFGQAGQQWGLAGTEGDRRQVTQASLGLRWRW